MSNNNDNIEQIYILLLDYIEGNLTDEKQIQRIEELIETNPAFRETYNELLSSRELLNKMEFKQPDELYFATLLPKIRDRLEQRKSHKTSISLLKYWRVLIPALTVILVIFLLRIPRSPENISVPHFEMTVTTQDSSLNNKENVPITENDLSNKNNVKPVKPGDETTIEKSPKRTKEPFEFSVEENGLEESDFQEILYNEVEEELMIEREFEQLSPEKQEIIINKIKEIQL